MNEARYWDKNAKRYDRSMLLFGRPMAPLRALLANAVRGRARVLELAAGTGLLTPALAASAKAVVATDYASAMVSLLEARVRDAQLTNVTCAQADIYALTYDDASFDAVVAANVLHLVPDLDAALTAMKRVLAPGGTLLVPTFCHDATKTSWLVSRVLALTGFPGHRRFTPESLRRALVNNGLAVTRFEVLPGIIPIAYAETTVA